MKDHESEKDSLRDDPVDAVIDDDQYRQLLRLRRRFIDHHLYEKEMQQRRMRTRRMQLISVGSLAIAFAVFGIAYAFLSPTNALNWDGVTISFAVSLVAVIGALFSSVLAANSRDPREFLELDLLTELNQSWMLIDELKVSIEKLREQLSEELRAQREDEDNPNG